MVDLLIIDSCLLISRQLSNQQFKLYLFKSIIQFIYPNIINLIVINLYSLIIKIIIFFKERQKYQFNNLKIKFFFFAKSGDKKNIYDFIPKYRKQY